MITIYIHVLYLFWVALGFHLGHVSVLFTTYVACIARFVFLLAFCRCIPLALCFLPFRRLLLFNFSSSLGSRSVVFHYANWRGAMKCRDLG